MTDPQSSRPTSEPEESASSSGQQFITHHVTKLDTLAGVAIRYNASVADIKRCNGLLSDSAMYARETLLIPTQRLPLGQEYSTWAGMIVTHYGTLGTSPEPPSSHVAQLHLIRSSQGAAGSMGRAYHSTSTSILGSDDDDDMCHLLMPASRGVGSSRRGPQEVELTERMDDGGFDADGGEEQLRRRRGGEGNSGEAGSSLSPAPSDGGHIPGSRAGRATPPPLRPPRQRLPGGEGGRGRGLGALRAWASSQFLPGLRQETQDRQMHPLHSRTPPTRRKDD
ncbi:hypothetical protein ACKKBF_B17990 [Auxenochlorella protothecoides x Auxenochlorella symbiontica]